MKKLLLSLIFLAAPALQASVIFEKLITDLDAPRLSSTDPFTTGQRLFRTGNPTFWGDPIVFPGLTGVAGNRAYDLFTFAIPYATPIFWQISVDFPNVPDYSFVSAYRNSFDPGNLATNYIGDIGNSGNNFGFPRSFQVITDPGEALVVFVHRIAVNLAGDFEDLPYGLLVEAFDNQFYDDLVRSEAIPEPATMSLLGGALLALALAAKRRQAQRG